MDIVLLVTSAQGEMCGVSDYTTRLAAAFSGIGANVSIEFLENWSLQNVLDIRKRYGGRSQTVFHMQYPSLHVGNSVSPGLLPLLLPNTFVTLHEFRLFNILRKMIFLLPALLSKKIIFSNDEEKALFQSYFPFAEKRLTVIPIGNNIARVATRADTASVDRVVYFGQISRNKGIEFFVDTIARLRAQNFAVEAELIGALVDQDQNFIDFVKGSAERYDIRLRLNMPPEAVSVALSEATIALLPFPDGVSNKRGSALACLDHGVTVLTTHTPMTPEWLSDVTHAISSPDDASALIARIASGDVPRAKAPDVLSREMRARDWKEIAQEHLRLYGIAADDHVEAQLPRMAS